MWNSFCILLTDKTRPTRVTQPLTLGTPTKPSPHLFYAKRDKHVSSCFINLKGQKSKNKKTQSVAKKTCQMKVFHERLSWRFLLISSDQRRPCSCLCHPPEVRTWLLCHCLLTSLPLCILCIIRVAQSILLSCQCNSSRTTAEPVTGDGSVSEPGAGILFSLQSWKTDHVWHPRDDYPVKIRKEAFLNTFCEYLPASVSAIWKRGSSEFWDSRCYSWTGTCVFMVLPEFSWDPASFLKILFPNIICSGWASFVVKP